jgi:MYXO-CTERM domain-containing protein
MVPEAGLARGVPLALILRVDGAKGIEMTFRTSACVAGAVLSLSQLAAADIISIQSLGQDSTSGLGSFTGSIQYTPSGSNSGTLIVSLTNTTNPASLSGYITGFAFNFHSTDPSASLSLVAEDFHFTGITDVPCPPFGNFDAGAALGGNWTGGGNPTRGIPIGSSGSFTFDVTASDAQSLGAADFISSEPGRSAFDFVVRFRGFANGGSDKVPGIPSPGATALLSLGGLIALRRKR